MSLYCPKCKNEYQEGYTHCADCDCDLVSFEVLNQKVPLYFGKEDEIDVLMAFLEANHMKTVEKRVAEEESVFEIYVDGKEEKTASALLKVYLSDKRNSIEDQVKQELKDIYTMEQMYEPVKVHENATAKGKEYKSTGVMLIVVGLIGIVIDILMFTGHFVIKFTGDGKYMSCGVMGALFLIFMFFGFSSLKSGDEMLAKGDEEESLKNKINSWAKDNLTKDAIEDGEDFSNMDETVAYFKRTENMKNKILENFKLDEEFLDEIVEKYYNEIFGE